MGAKVQTYCDGCGADVGEARVGVDCVQMTAIGTNGTPTLILLCTDFEPPRAAEDEEGKDGQRSKMRGCAKKVLSKTVLAKLYEEVEEYTGDPKEKPFAL